MVLAAPLARPLGAWTLLVQTFRWFAVLWGPAVVFVLRTAMGPGWVVMAPSIGSELVMLLVPTYTAVVYGVAAVRAVRAVRFSPGDIAAVGIVGAPDEPPECFVVTTASHGDDGR
jgi:hypothetical protein